MEFGLQNIGSAAFQSFAGIRPPFEGRWRRCAHRLSRKRSDTEEVRRSGGPVEVADEPMLEALA
jgi:hypothetical protein